MTITKIQYDLPLEAMSIHEGEEEKAQKNREWMRKQIQLAFPDAEVKVTSIQSAVPITIDGDEQDLAKVQEEIDKVWNRSEWLSFKKY